MNEITEEEATEQEEGEGGGKRTHDNGLQGQKADVDRQQQAHRHTEGEDSQVCLLSSDLPIKRQVHLHSSRPVFSTCLALHAPHTQRVKTQLPLVLLKRSQ